MDSFTLIQLLLGNFIGIIKVSGQTRPFVRDCKQLKDYGFYESGVYHVTPAGTCRGLDVYCDMTTEGGGWLVFQRREDGSVNFYRDWDDYQFGFGNLTGEHWLGNYALHQLTRQGHYEMRIDLADWEGNSKVANYRFFRLEHTKEMYTLSVSGYYGNAGDALLFHNGMAFSTKDKDNDKWKTNCAVDFKGAWWYDNCHRSNLNGLYLKGNHTTYADGVNWSRWKGSHYSLKKTEMKIRRT